MLDAAQVNAIQKKKCNASKVMDYLRARDKMVEEQLMSRGIKDPLVLTAMTKVPRRLFVVEEMRAQAYDDRPLPIGEGQTISQPYIAGKWGQSEFGSK